MATSDLVLNPYQPVLVQPHRSACCGFQPHSALEVNVERRWLLRRIRLLGYVDAEIEWDARAATEFVRVDGIKAASKTSFLYVPRFEFDIPVPGRLLQAAIDVRLAWLVRVIAFQFTIEDRVIYYEGHF